MKVGLVGVDSQYIHRSLAIRALERACQDAGLPVSCLEYNINQQRSEAYGELLREGADVLCFSVYIWNYEWISKLTRDLRAAQPALCIVWGGPMASYECETILRQNPAVDYVIAGEGEESLPELLKALERGEGTEWIPGIGSRANPRPRFRTVEGFAELPFPYTDAFLRENRERILYYESSRGCPFRCSYCLSGGEVAVRERPAERVKEDLSRFLQAGVRTVKFVDRTFNCHEERAREILRFVLEAEGETRFHFEIGADLLSDETVSLLQKAPPGRIQLEAGVQSTNPKTLGAVCRKTDLDRLFRNVKALREKGNLHLHLDLIAGLPFEGFERFRQSFHEVYALCPHDLQLGFLKLLPGSPLAERAEEYGLVCRDYPPFEIIRSRELSAGDIVRLKGVAFAAERFSGESFALAIPWLMEQTGLAPFDLFLELAEACRAHTPGSLSAADCFRLLYRFGSDLLAADKAGLLRAKLYADSLCRGLLIPELLEPTDKAEKDSFYRAAHSAALAKRLGFSPANVREYYKKLRFARFSCDPLERAEGLRYYVFDWHERHPVSGRYPMEDITDLMQKNI